MWGVWSTRGERGYRGLLDIAHRPPVRLTNCHTAMPGRCLHCPVLRAQTDKQFCIMLDSDFCSALLSRTPPHQVHVPATGNTALRVPAGDNIMGVLRALGNYGTLILALQVCVCVGVLSCVGRCMPHARLALGVLIFFLVCSACNLHSTNPAVSSS